MPPTIPPCTATLPRVFCRAPHCTTQNFFLSFFFSVTRPRIFFLLCGKSDCVDVCGVVQTVLLLWFASHDSANCRGWCQHTAPTTYSRVKPLSKFSTPPFACSSLVQWRANSRAPAFELKLQVFLPMGLEKHCVRDVCVIVIVCICLFVVEAISKLVAFS